MSLRAPTFTRTGPTHLTDPQAPLVLLLERKGAKILRNCWEVPLWDHARDLASQAEGLASQRGEMPSRRRGQGARTVSRVNLSWAPHPQT